jgi:phosphoenolpyruvate-protein phosphotransferase
MDVNSLVLLAPLAGWSASLDEVPDPVFAARMPGDGVAIDPTCSTLHAVCDAHVISLPETRHAVTLRAACGAQLLMHIGIETVALAGAGFEAHVGPGDRVRAGEPLITFDMDLIARRAKSLMTPVLLVHAAEFRVLERTVGRAVEAGDPIMILSATPQGLPVPSPSSGRQASAPAETAAAQRRRVRIALPHGIHARPAAQLSSVLRSLDAEVSLSVHGRDADARSTVALMALGVHNGDEVEIRAAGPAGPAALAAVERVLRGGGECAAPTQARGAEHAPRAHAARPARRIETPPGEADPNDAATRPLLHGVTASAGMAVGQARWLTRQPIAVRETGAGVEQETGELARARDRVRAHLEQSVRGAEGDARGILEAHLALLDDPELSARARSLIERGASAASAWRQAIRASVDALRALADARMAERADDLRDLEGRVLAALAGEARPPTADLPPESILLAQELLPSELLAFDAAKLAGIALAGGGATSHVAILAAAMGIPALAALGPELARIADGTALILDGKEAVLHVDPPPERLQATRDGLALEARRRLAEREAAQRECRTADGARIAVLANLGSLAEAHAALRNGAEGCGLLRTEFLFIDRQRAPSASEQLHEYQRIAAALDRRPLTIRTLDAGGDKPMPYLPLPEEANPALGLRGIRTGLARPQLLREQLRAVLAVRPFGQCRILLPMITEAAEIRAVRALTAELAREAGRAEPVALGVMIETPAAALMAASLCAEADFFSIGTNDLTQYTLAMDRGHAELAPRIDGLHPAVLRLVRHAVEAARAHARPVAVCGGLASDPAAVPILIGLGLHELSAVPALIPRLKALIATLTLEECVRLAHRALEQESAAAVRRLVSP